MNTTRLQLAAIAQKYLLICVTIAVVFVADGIYLYPKMLRYQHQNRDISSKVNTWQFTDKAQKQALITIWECDTRMNHLLIAIIKYQYLVFVILLAINVIAVNGLRARAKRAEEASPSIIEKCQL